MMSILAVLAGFAAHRRHNFAGRKRTSSTGEIRGVAVEPRLNNSWLKSDTFSANDPTKLFNLLGPKEQPRQERRRGERQLQIACTVAPGH
jgi:hypothetical protein